MLGVCKLAVVSVSLNTARIEAIAPPGVAAGARYDERMMALIGR